MQAWARKLSGRFIVLDGADGSGKSTAFGRLASWCRAQGLEVAEVREPGGTRIGEQVRAILLDPGHTEMSLRCEMLLYMASRAQLVDEVIRPALSRRALVLADRFVSSTLAYQGAAGGLAPEEILAVAAITVGPTRPDLTVIFDVDQTTAAARRGPRPDRIESRGPEYHGRVRRGFLEQAAADPSRHLVLDASGEAEVVFAMLLAGLEAWAKDAPRPT